MFENNEKLEHAIFNWFVFQTVSFYAEEFKQMEQQYKNA